MKQVMADLALTQVANRAVGDLTQSEYRRLMIGVQLVRDPGESNKINTKEIKSSLNILIIGNHFKANNIRYKFTKFYGNLLIFKVNSILQQYIEDQSLLIE